MRRLRKQHFWSIDRKCVSIGGFRDEKTGSIRMARVFSTAQGACAGGFSTISRMGVQPFAGVGAGNLSSEFMERTSLPRTLLWRATTRASTHNVAGYVKLVSYREDTGPDGTVHGNRPRRLFRLRSLENVVPASLHLSHMKPTFDCE
jgi:hypothetical protein